MRPARPARIATRPTGGRGGVALRSLLLIIIFAKHVVQNGGAGGVPPPRVHDPHHHSALPPLANIPIIALSTNSFSRQ